MTNAEKALEAFDLWMKNRDIRLKDHAAKIRKSLQRVDKVQGLVDALKFYASPASYEFIHGTTSYMPIEVDEGYKAKQALAAFGADDLEVGL